MGDCVGASSFFFLGGGGGRGFWVVLHVFYWLRVILDGFRWFAVLVVKPISQHTEQLTLSVLMVVRD